MTLPSTHQLRFPGIDTLNPTAPLGQTAVLSSLSANSGLVDPLAGRSLSTSSSSTNRFRPYPGNSPEEAHNLGIVNGQKSYQEHVGDRNPDNELDIFDFIHIDLTAPGSLTLSLIGLQQSGNFTADADLYLVWDANNNFQVDDGELIGFSENIGNGSEFIKRTGLQAGSYYAVVTGYDAYATNSVRRTDYTLTVTADAAGGTLPTARNVGVLGGNRTYSDYVGTLDTHDVYRFQLNNPSSVQISLTGLSADANLYLIQDLNGNGVVDSSDEILRYSDAGGTTQELITLPGLAAGNYYISVVQGASGSTNYTLNLSATTASTTIQTLSGSLEADLFTPNLNYDRTLISGNGNVYLGDGYYDVLNLSNLASTSVKFSLVQLGSTGVSGGVAYNPGNGTRLFDRITLASGQEILFEGIDLIWFGDRIIPLFVNPSDPLFNQQWNLHAMGVHTAWRFTQGTSNVMIGIEDTGLGVNSLGFIHDDLRTTTINGTSYYDDFSTRSTSHGTAVQSIIAANTNNNLGLSGINWNSPVHSIDVIPGPSGDTGDYSLAAATQELINSAGGRRLIINLSLSGSDPNPAELNQLVAQNPNVLFVISSGNDNRSSLDYPASLGQNYGNVVAVGAIDDSGNRWTTPAEGSNYGFGLSLMGPTEVIAARATKTNSGVSFDYYDFQPLGDYFSGTSAATPNVSGVASLVWSANPNLTASQVHEILQQTAYDLGAPGDDLEYGAGLVNADAAVRRALALAQNPSVA
ncbi:MAG: S8 family serine peptidase [Leptolyngbyaceae cyanobacterium RU_5_1]|nr:S8 family serine peptidase [Leptolyngbyaceae cyanobacterium RU_5_1]